jgi:hypothetical protein
VLRFGGKDILQPGDTVLLEQHLELLRVDVLFVSPTEHNMHIHQSRILVSALEPEHIFPQHFGTYEQTEENRYWTAGFPDELRESLPARLRKRYHKLEQGEVIMIK